MWSLDDLVVAPATPPGGGCRGIVRIGGAGLDGLLGALFSPAPPGFAVAGGGCRVVTAVPAADGPLAPFGRLPVTILHWPGPGGPTGQPLAEVQLPGAGPIVAAVVRAACDQSARLARGGEFSLRSFLAGRLGLIEAEAILAVVDAATPAELSAALDRMAGGVGRDVAAIRESLLDLAADVEAAIDFADERTPDAVPAAEQALLAAVCARLAAAAAAVDRVAARLEARDAGPAAAVPRVVVVGAPNIGKSSLVNALLGRDAALVADEPGTTRDAVAGRLAAGEGGPTCLLVDVAGLDDEAGATPRSAIDAAAQARAREEFARADVIVSCRDAASGTPVAESGRRPDRPPVTVLTVLTRCDRAGEGAVVAGELCTSARTGEGIARLRERILRAAAAVPSPSSPATVRLATGLAAARDALAAARAAAAAVATGGADEAVVAGLVREAVAILGEVTGAEIGDDLVDRIFSRHCIGK